MNINYLRQQNLLAQFLEALDLKKSMMKCHCMLSIIYFILIICGVSFHDTLSRKLLQYETNSEIEATLAKIVICKELVEIVLLGSMFINLRPRNWPQYFTLDVSYDPMVGEAIWRQDYDVPF